MSEFVMVAVPRDRVLDVYWWLSFETHDTPTPLMQAVPGSPAGSWTPELLEDQFAKSPKSIKALQKHLAANPGVEYTTDELAKVMNVERGWQSVAGALGAYTRRIKNRYGLDWPFSCRYSEDRGKYVYAMDATTAEVISAL
jgi:hypothetical protein